MTKIILVVAITISCFASSATELICHFDEADGIYREKDGRLSTKVKIKFDAGRVIILAGEVDGSLMYDKYGFYPELKKDEIIVRVEAYGVNQDWLPQAYRFTDFHAVDPLVLNDSYVHLTYETHSSHNGSDATENEEFFLDRNTKEFELNFTFKSSGFLSYEKTQLKISGECYELENIK